MILIGAFAQNYYLKEKTLAERVEDYKIYLSKYFSIPHPSQLIDFGALKILGLKSRWC